MSGHSSSTVCPNCGKDADLYQDYKPFDHTIVFCPHCGLSITPRVNYLSIEELNLYRIDNELEPLKELPKQTFNY